jgi:hypothetical protein
VEVLTLSAMISFWSGVSAGGIAGLTAAALAFAKKMADDIKEEHSLKNDPHYAMGRLGAISKSRRSRGLAITKPSAGVTRG